MEKEKIIIIITGKRWFDKVNGNTYHSVKCFPIFEEHFKSDDYVCEIESKYNYGYGDQFIDTGLKKLSEKEIIPKYKGGSYSDYCRKNNVSFYTTVSDVSRKKDL